MGHDDREPIGDQHDWIAGAVALARNEARRYVATLWRFCAAPGRFGAAWATGRVDALNPLGFLASSAGVLGLVVHVCQALLGGAGDSLVEELLEALHPYLLFACFGVVAHPFLRRKRLRSSVAMALYAGAGPATVCAVTIMLITFALKRALHIPADHALIPRRATWGWHLLFDLVVFAPLAWFWTCLVAALAGLHGRSRWRAALAVAVAQLVLGLVAGAMHALGLGGTGGAFLPSLIVGFARNAHGIFVPRFEWWY